MRYVVGVGASGALAQSGVERGLERMRAHPSLRVLAVSALYANPAFGGVTCERFVNAAVVVDTPLGAGSLLHALHAIERECGRVRGVKNSARALDLDVLWALDAMGPLGALDGLEGGLAVPHPRLLERASAVVPAVDAIERAGLAVPAVLLAGARGSVRATLTPLHGLDRVPTPAPTR